MVTLKVPRNRPPKYGIDFLEAILREQMTKYGIPIRYQNSTKKLSESTMNMIFWTEMVCTTPQIMIQLQFLPYDVNTFLSDQY